MPDCESRETHGPAVLGVTIRNGGVKQDESKKTLELELTRILEISFNNIFPYQP